MGRFLNRAHEIRQAADYNGNVVELSDAKEMVEKAEAFVAVIRAEFMQEDSNNNN